MGRSLCLRRCARAPVTMLALAFAAAGCGLMPSAPTPIPVPAHFGKASDVDAVRRIMVLPFDCAPGVTADTTVLRATLLAELAKIQRFEIVPLPDGADEDSAVYQGLRRGLISTEVLAALGQRYQLDGVLLGTVTGYRAYRPPQLGLRVQLLSLHTAAAVWAADAFYDSADAAVIDDIRHYSASALAEPDSLHDWEIVLISPQRFATFVAHRLVGTWRDA